ncbi:MAG TPA: DUF3618 domain-containing protein [Acidimicrobiia bacterium]
MTERGADEIQREIEKARVSLADTVDQIVYRTQPKRIVDRLREKLKEKAQTPEGKAVIGAAGAIVVILLIRRVRNR